MQWVRVEPYLEDDFLERVRRAYRRAIAHGGAKGPVWSKIDAHRADIHAALISDDVGALRGIFSNPSASDLFYGFDVHCRSVGGCHDAATLFDAILADGRTRSAVRLVQRVERAGIEIKNAAVVELGPGMGRGAYAAYRAGLTDYTTIDLPLGLVAQACFIGKLLGPDAIWFAGEAALNVRDRIRLHCPGELPERRFGVALNVDSLTEMSGREAFDYAHWLGIHATTFISINHTSNFFSAAELMAFAGMHRRSVRRYVPEGYGDWLDYREEIYSLGPMRLPAGRRAAFMALLEVRRIVDYARRHSGRRQ